jgi:hypothetical protein
MSAIRLWNNFMLLDREEMPLVNQQGDLKNAAPWPVRGAFIKSLHSERRLTITVPETSGG